MFGVIVFALVAVAAASAEQTCRQDLKPMENFDMTKYAGKWYDLGIFPDLQTKCGTTEYTLEGSDLNSKVTYYVGDKQHVLDSVVKRADDANNAGKLISHITIKGQTQTSNIRVLATDYTKYAIAYVCLEGDHIGFNNRSFVMVMSRTQHLEGEAKTNVSNFLKTLNMKDYKDLDSSVLSVYSASSCKV